MARRTLQSYLDLMSHALGKTPDARHVLVDDFNDAGRALYHAGEQPPWNHTWSWATSDNNDFTLPGGQVQEVQLPDDFGTLSSLTYRNSFIGQIVPCSIGQLNQVRRSFDVDPLRVFMCFDVGHAQQNGQGSPRKVAAFWPPRDNDQTGLVLSYNRSWVDMLAGDTNRIPDVPAEFERLLVMISRAFAVHLEDQTGAFEDEQVKAEMNRLVALDSGRQTNYGRAIHSVRVRAQKLDGLTSWYGRRIIRP